MERDERRGLVGDDDDNEADGDMGGGYRDPYHDPDPEEGDVGQSGHYYRSSGDIRKLPNVPKS